MAFSLFTFLTANRVRDCIRIYCYRFTKLPADATICRRFKWSIAQTKNDMSGQGPESGRCFVIPCSCIKNSSKVEAEAFARKLLIDPDAHCCRPCFYQVSCSIVLFFVSYSNYLFRFL